ncbi:MAG: DUF4855 domain-containing protein [Armatimonadota bacterium]|nr:DUF4855 domain-containing protein [Armatimonadota bacterium]
MLCYLAPDRWSAADFRPYVAWLDRAGGGVPRDWFYDGWLFLMYGGAPSGGLYARGTANAADWHFYLDLLFDAERNLAALDATIDGIGRVLDDPDRRCPVIIMIPYLAADAERFGDVDGDGEAEDPADPDGRLTAYRWVVDEVLRRWRARDWQHLDLWGFYWMHEGIRQGQEQDVRAVADYVHERGYGLHWIPWHRAPGWDRAAELGVDFTVMQPNFAFMDVPRRMAVPDEQRLTANANLAREHGLGVEMEMHVRVATDPGQLLNLQLYLNHGVDELDGYMNEAVRAYYQAGDLIAQLYRSPRAQCRRTYDDLHAFHRGTYRRRALSLSEGAPCTIRGRPEPRLTDGLWLTHGGRPGRVVSAAAGSVIEVRLPRAEMVGDVRVHVAGRAEGSPQLPTGVRLSTSMDGREFTAGAQAGCGMLAESGGWRSGFVPVPFAPRPARVVRVELSGSTGGSVGLDEVLIYPAPGLLWGKSCEIEGQTIGEGAVLDSSYLTDGRLAEEAGDGLAFEGDGSVAFTLASDVYLGEALAHARWSGQQRPSCQVVIRDGEHIHRSEAAEPGGDGEGWARIGIPTVRGREVRFELTGGPSVVWDELQLRRAPNLALDKPYDLSPAFPAKYPDTGGSELTDGVLTEEGFSDGRTVGWYGQSADRTVLIDLGEPRRVSAVRAHAEGGGYAAVFFPEMMESWGSLDGETWSLLSTAEPQREVTMSEVVDGEDHELAWLAQEFAATPARLVRMRFAARGWLMLGEVQVIAGGRNVALGRPYHLLPPPTSSEQYADDGQRLTDGEYTTSGAGWNRAVGWNEGRPEITIDLLQQESVATVRAHVLGGGSGAVFFPESIAVATSPDGETWTEETLMRGHPPESGHEHLAAYMETTLAPRSARWVRLRLARDGWAMVDEVEVYRQP